MLVCIFKCSEGRTGREGGREQTETEGQAKFRVNFFFLFFAESLALQESQIASVSWYPPLFLPFLSRSLMLSFLPFILSTFFFVWHVSFFFFPPHPLLFYSGSCGGVGSCWLAWRRVTMSVGKQSLSRIPLSLWQSSSPMKPYQ